MAERNSGRAMLNKRQQRPRSDGRKHYDDKVQSSRWLGTNKVRVANTVV